MNWIEGPDRKDSIMLMRSRNVFSCPCCDFCIPDYGRARARHNGGAKRKDLRRQTKRSERRAWRAEVALAY